MGQPHKCPLCLGSGCASQEIQKAQIEATGQSSTVCKACAGSGMVWDDKPARDPLDTLRMCVEMVRAIQSSDGQQHDFGPPYDQR